MAQMKEQNRTPEKQLGDEDIANLSDTEFKTLVVRMFKDGGVGRPTSPQRSQ